MIEAKELVFIDFETVPAYKNLSDAPDNIREAYKKKFKHEVEAMVTVECAKRNVLIRESGAVDYGKHWTEKAALYPEFNKIVCASVCAVHEGVPFITAYCGEDEHAILLATVNFITKANKVGMCAHNGLNFDFPLFGKKLLQHRIPLPQVMKVIGKKLWEVNLFDTMAMWKFTDFKGSGSLDLICLTLGVPSPKTGVDGSNVFDLYQAGKFKEIAEYCNGDVWALVQIYVIMNEQKPFEKSTTLPYKPLVKVQ